MFKDYFIFAIVFFCFADCFTSFDALQPQELQGILKRKSDYSGSENKKKIKLSKDVKSKIRKKIVLDDVVEVASIISKEEYKEGGPEIERHYLFEPVAQDDLHKARGDYDHTHDKNSNRSFFITEEALRKETERREQVKQTQYEDDFFEFEEIMDDLKYAIIEMPENIIDIADVIHTKDEQLKIVFKRYCRRFPTKAMNDFCQERDYEGNQIQCYVDIHFKIKKHLKKYKLKLNEILKSIQKQRTQCFQIIFGHAKKNNLEIEKLKFLLKQYNEVELRIMEQLNGLRTINREIHNRDFEKKGLYDKLFLMYFDQ